MASNAPREKDGHLETLVAVQANEIEPLKAQLEFFKSNGGRGAVECAKCGFVQGASEDVILLRDTPDALIFPNEIFLLIGTQLEPGTRSLLKLARTCRAMYWLLLPRLYESFSVQKVHGKVGMAQRDDSLTHTAIPYGLGLVKKLDVYHSPQNHPTSWGCSPTAQTRSRSAAT